MMYTLKIFEGNELVEQATCEDVAAMLSVFKLANKVHNGRTIEVWNERNELVHRGLIDFPKLT